MCTHKTTATEPPQTPVPPPDHPPFPDNPDGLADFGTPALNGEGLGV